MKIKVMTRILCSALLTQIALLSDFLYSQSDFYQGKTIGLIMGTAPGGSSDMMVKSALPFLKKYIPGEAAIVSGRCWRCCAPLGRLTRRTSCRQGPQESR